MNDSQALRRALADNPYAWPGGYPRHAVTDDGGTLCHGCMAAEAERIDDAIPGDGFYIAAIDINWEDGDLHCDHCGTRIESAYAEED